MRSSAKRYYVFLLVFTFLSTHASAITLSRTIEIKDVGELPKTYQKNRSTIKLGTKIWEKIKSLFNNKQKVGDAIQGLSYVKEYLQFLGYFNNTLIINDTVTSDFQSGLKEYQKNFNLKLSCKTT
jgi:hypothetical protein